MDFLPAGAPKNISRLGQIRRKKCRNRCEIKVGSAARRCTERNSGVLR